MTFYMRAAEVPPALAQRPQQDDPAQRPQQDDDVSALYDPAHYVGGITQEPGLTPAYHVGGIAQEPVLPPADETHGGPRRYPTAPYEVRVRNLGPRLPPPWVPRLPPREGALSFAVPFDHLAHRPFIRDGPQS